MEYAKINGLEKKVSRFFMGTLGMFPSDKEKHFATLDAAYDLGITAIDTARAYDSEPTVGEWIKTRGIRENIVLLSKGAHPTDYRERVTPYDIDSDLFETLAELQTDYLDIYLLHRDNTALPVGPIVEKLNEHQAAGRIKIFGGSNWTHQRLDEANEYAYAHNLTPMTVSSPNFCLAEQVQNPFAPGCVTISGNANKEAQEWYTKNQMPVLAYSSLARGFFSGRVTREMFANHPDDIDMFCRIGYCCEENFVRLDRCKEIAEEKGCTVPQVAMAYVLDSPLNTFPVIGAANRAEMESSFGALDVKLTPQEVLYLELKSDTRK
ncbi:aryl-alcohol dehydrogenase-like predicted oxidoreductase [Catenibacillus scindens]|uniref:Aryl-alcohol dehydrogenase-like predicted oxidoreductase n=1 Tax=Catenibacillus scindens TaxID=673271 RepID=A0A7W8HC32_9FIRM|nr:aldo/keto reductase [Catenibacillus scindens]MBB5265594.1 aryl-alcohol dehydrogenase-like predicted oxidoreductase [Catenibacillus scindens]